jgi:hypothetical protein
VDRRIIERAVRVGAVTFARWVALGQIPREGAALALGISTRTLAEWERDWERDRLGSPPRGRPAERSDRERRNLVVTVLNLMGPEVGVPTLQALFSDMPRREVEDLVRRYKRLYAKKSQLELKTLRWLRAGAVWAADHSDPPAPIDGVYPKAFAVRDLESRKQLQWSGVPDETAPSTAAELEVLFRLHGPPLVLKSDNHGAFRGEETVKLLRRWGVVPLLSPVRTPRYNGSCEAGIGSMKRRTYPEAARHDRPTHWTSDDLEAARLQANQTTRPWGVGEPTPDEAWHRREPIADEMRQRFAHELSYYRDKVRRENGCLPGVPSDWKTEARCERIAIARALVVCGHLQIRRRRIPLPLKSLFRTKIS